MEPWQKTPETLGIWKIENVPFVVFGLPSLKLTFSHLKMDDWKTTFLLGSGLFSVAFAVSFREGMFFWFASSDPMLSTSMFCWVVTTRGL